MQLTSSRILSIGLAVYLAMLFTTLLIASKVPSLGFDAVPGPVAVSVRSVDPSGPAADILQNNDEIIGIHSATGSLTLTPWDAVAEPDDASNYSQYREFFKRQALLWQISNTAEIHLDIRRHNQPLQVSIVPQDDRGLSHYPILFWYQIACASLIMLMGIAAWAFAHNETGPRMYAFAGTAMALAIFSSAIYTTRELLLPATEFLWLSRTNQFGAMMFAAFGTAMMWYYPTRLGNFRAAIVLPLIALGILTVNYTQLFENMDLVVRAPLILWLIADIVLAYWQWQRTTKDPVQRARLKWLIYSWFAGVVGYLALVITPQLLGSSSVVAQPYAWGLFVLTYLGIALGIVRYRLFDLDRWVLHAWFWFFCGVVIIIFDAFLVLWLHIESSLGLFITLALAGWLYFPLRQWFMSRIMPKAIQNNHVVMPTIIERAFRHSSHSGLEQAWPKALNELFQPLQLQRINQTLTETQLSSDGLTLHIPALDQSFFYALSHAGLGHRLFNQQDRITAEHVRTLFGHAHRYQHAHQEGIRMERERLAADLHDDIGSRLLTIVYRSQEPKIADTARDTLQALRVAMQDLQQGGAALSQVVRYWQREHHEHCQEAGINLSFQLDEALNKTVITAPQRSQLTRIVRELISNGVRHASARQIQISLTHQNECLLLNYQDDGVGIPKEALQTVSSGMGLNNIKQRCESLGGDFSHLVSASGTHLVCTLPILGQEPT